MASQASTHTIPTSGISGVQMAETFLCHGPSRHVLERHGSICDSSLQVEPFQIFFVTHRASGHDDATVVGARSYKAFHRIAGVPRDRSRGVMSNGIASVCPVLRFFEPESNKLSTLHKCNHHILVGLLRSQWRRSVARWWKGAAFTEKKNVELEDEEFALIDVESRGSEPNKQSNDPPPEFTGTKPSEFKSYRRKVKLWLLFTRTPAQLQGFRVLSKYDSCVENNV